MNLKFTIGKFFWIYTILCVFSTNLVLGQNKTQTGKSIIKGKIIDANDQKELEFATVSLFCSKDSSFIAGTITNKKGEFELKELSADQYYFKVEYLGYQPKLSKEIQLAENQKKLLKKSIALERDTESLGEVEVTGQRHFERVEFDKKVYAVSKSAVADGGTMSDVLVTIGEIDTDVDGNITIRRSQAQVLIDGRKTKLLGASPSEVLNALPANSVDRVEVITTPSAKFSAEGSGGIVNIVLKKNKIMGFNASTNIYVGTKDRHGVNVSMNKRTGKFNFSGSFNYKNDWAGRDFDLSRDIFSTSEDQNTFTNRIDEKADIDFGNEAHLANLGVDYLIDKKNTVSVSYGHKYYNQNWNGVYDYKHYNLSNTVRSLTSRDFKNEANVYAASYLRKFDKKGQQLTVDFSYRDILSSNSIARNTEPLPLVTTDDETDIKGLIARIDYVHPMGKSGKLETGFYHESEQNDFYDRQNTVVVGKYDETIHAAYIMYTGKKGKLSYQFGLRSEYTDINTAEDKYDDDFIDFFPSFNLGYKLNKKLSVNLGYSKTIYRAGRLNYIPFQMEADVANQREGNIDVKPFYSHQPELTFSYRAKKFSTSATLYYTYKKDAINGFQYINDDQNAVISFLNTDYEVDAGILLNTTLRLKKWIWINIANFYGKEEYVAKKDNEYGLGSYEKYHFSNKVTAQFRLPKSFTLNVAAYHQEPIAVFQGEYKHLYYMNIALSKKVFKRKGNLQLQLFDVFNTYNHRVKMYGEDFTQYKRLDYEKQWLRLSFRYSFGKRYKVSKSKKKKGRNRYEGEVL